MSCATSALRSCFKSKVINWKAVSTPTSYNNASPQTRSFVKTPIHFKPTRPQQKSAKNTTTVIVQAAAQTTMTRPWLIIGGGRVGEALAGMGAGGDKIIRRGEAISGVDEGPIVVCTRNDALQSVVDATPEARRKDLVFIQNGMLQPFLDANNLSDATQVLVYFAIAKLGDPPSDGITDVNPEGLTAAYGIHAKEIAERLHAAGLSCKLPDKTEFQKAMLEKLIWISAFMLVGAKHGGVTVGEVESKHTEEVAALINELAAAGGNAFGVTLDAGVVERLCAYARSVAHFPTAVKEFEWRNGWFYGLTQEALKSGKEDPCPLQTALLTEVGAI